MRKIFHMAAALVAAFLLVSCAAPSEEERTPSGTQSPVNVNSPAATAERTGSVSTPSPQPHEKNKLPQYEFYADKTGHYQSSLHVSLGVYRDAIIDAYGETVYTLPENEECLLYADGYFLSKAGDTQYLKKYDGSVVFSTETLGVTGFGLVNGSSADKKFLSDGYVLAYKTNESYAGVNYEIGVLDTNGQWVVPLADSNPLLSSGMECSQNVFEESLIYVGEGCLVLEVRDGGQYDARLYDIEQNRVVSFQSDQDISVMEYLAEEAWFENGVSYDTYGETIYEIHNDGKVRIHGSVAGQEDIAVFTVYGFHVNEDGSVTSLVSNGWNSVLINNKKGIVRDFAGMDMEVGAFDGTAPVIIANSEGTNYFSIVRLDGEFLFEPVKLAEDVIYVMTENGKGIGVDDEPSYSHGIKLIIDDTGGILYTSKDPSTKLYISNGIVREVGEPINGDKINEYTRIRG